MAAVEITISGVLYDKYNRTQQNVVLFGEASITGLHVGGGPIYPPGDGGGVKPPVDPGRPTFPIWGPPGMQPPDKPGYPPWVGGGPIPPEPPEIPTEDPNYKLKAVWVPAVGWVSVIVPVGDTPIPTPGKS